MATPLVKYSFWCSLGEIILRSYTKTKNYPLYNTLQSFASQFDQGMCYEKPIGTEDGPTFCTKYSAEFLDILLPSQKIT